MKMRIIPGHVVALAALSMASFPAGAAPGPIRVSPNGRYFVDARGEPFYFLADTQWELFRRYSLGDAKRILENRKTKGFSVVMVMLTGVGNGTGPNLEGEHPWVDNNPATPNPKYFAHVDAVVKLAQTNDIHLLIGIYHQTYGDRMTVDNARPWAAWVTRRYRDDPNIIWTIYPKALDSYEAIARKLAEGIQEGDRGRYLFSMHPDPSPASSSFMHAEPWLGFNSIQVWNRLDAIYPMAVADYQKSPFKPVTMLEGVYEGGEEYGYPVTPLLVRREAYYTCLAGGFHGYGHNDSWRVKPRWREALDDPGAKQMTVLRDVFTRLPKWWAFTPDPSVLSAGGKTRGDVLNLGGRSAEGTWIIAYIAGDPNIEVNMAKITAANSAAAEWVDPATGDREWIGHFPTSGTQPFTRPASWQDGVLVINAAEHQVRSTVDPAASAPRIFPIQGPLRVHPSNRRYFTDDSGRAIYLTGSHTWNSLQDMGYSDPPPAFDFAHYLDFLARHHHNFIRLWRWELPKWTERQSAQARYCAPHPWKRAGPGNALDNKPKFDLEKFDDDYFKRLRSRVEAAGQRGVYVSIMFFEGWGLRFVPDGWKTHPFNPCNNINGIDGDLNRQGKGLEIYALASPAITRLQEAYVRQVIDTVNDLDNVLYEISNENGLPSTDWQYHLIRFIHEYEKSKPKQHPVGITSDGFGGGDDTDRLFNSPADWISPSPDKNDYKENPPAAAGVKVVVADTDHLWGVGGNRIWVWKSFLRGLNPVWMDPYEKSSLWETLPENAENVRRSMGETRVFAERMNLTSMMPRDERASTGYCLANDGVEYLVYQPRAGADFSVSLKAGVYDYEWFDPAKGTMSGNGRVASSNGKELFHPPMDGDAVLYLKAR